MEPKQDYDMVSSPHQPPPYNQGASGHTNLGRAYPPPPGQVNPYPPPPGQVNPYPPPPGQVNPSGGGIVSMTASPVITSQVEINIGGLRQQLQSWRATQNIREWTSGLCGCLEDCCSCCYSWWCFPCFMCSLAAKLDEYPCGPSMCVTCFMIAMRTKTRTLFGIRGSICKDTCAVGCCPCCSMTQIWRELESVGI